MASQKAGRIPTLVYGTAWKKDATRALVKQAILSGFRGVDTAAQPKHYREALVGEGIRDACREGKIRRGDLHIQTKFTPIHGQDPRNVPYNVSDNIEDQVKASVASSLHHLRSSDREPAEPYIDCLILHSPYPTIPETEAAWRSMESLVPSRVRSLGISNVYHPTQLRRIYDFANIKPSVAQNRFYADTGYDKDIRAFCTDKGMVYQSFWTLTANPRLLRSDVVGRVADEVGVERAVALYALTAQLGKVSVLNGTTNPARMKSDLEGLKKVKARASQSLDWWSEVTNKFEELLAI